jgi:hypothetical protein
MPVVGFVRSRSPGGSASEVAAFRADRRRTGGGISDEIRSVSLEGRAT